MSPSSCYPSAQDCSFAVQGLTYGAFLNSVPPLLSGFATSEYGEYNAVSFSSVITQALWTSFTGGFSHSPVDDSGFAWRTNATSIDQFKSLIESLATSMTNNIRQFNLGGIPATGTVWKTETIIRVRWGWLLLPGTLVVLMVVFLGATMFQSARQRVWKSSSLAMLFHGLGSETRSQLGTLDKLDQMQQKAGQVKVQFHRTEEGWRLVS